MEPSATEERYQKIQKLLRKGRFGSWNLTVPRLRELPYGISSTTSPHRDGTVISQMQRFLGHSGKEFPPNGDRIAVTQRIESDRMLGESFVRRWLSSAEGSRELHIVDRLGYLQRVKNMGSLRGNAFGGVEATLSFMIHNTALRDGEVPEFGQPTRGEPYYLDFALSWYTDGTQMLHLEDVAKYYSPGYKFDVTNPEDPGESYIYDFYAWIGCTHHIEGRSGGRCITDYRCKKCDYRYTIDSSD